MLPKEQRISGREIFFLKQEKIQPIYGKVFGMVYKENMKVQKFGIIIPNKIVNKSFLRNKIKRLLFNLIRKFSFKTSGYFLFLAKKQASLCNKDEFESDLLLLKRKLNEDINIVTN